MDLQLKGKTALILGGSKGLGRGVADALAAEGVAVALVARGQDALDTAVAENAARGSNAAGFAADLANCPAVEDAANAARKQLGSIDILLNNSGGPPPSGVVGVAAKVWEDQFHAMVMPLLRITDLLIGDMRGRKGGRTLNRAPPSVVEPLAAIGVSNTLRSAIVGWAKTLATETARDGITVNTLLPGVIATDRTVQMSRIAAERQKISIEEAIQRTAQTIPVGRVGTAAEFGAVAAFLASPLAAYVTGSLIRIDGGVIRSV